MFIFSCSTPVEQLNQINISANVSIFEKQFIFSLLKMCWILLEQKLMFSWDLPHVRREGKQGVLRGQINQLAGGCCHWPGRGVTVKCQHPLWHHNVLIAKILCFSSIFLRNESQEVKGRLLISGELTWHTSNRPSCPYFYYYDNYCWIALFVL